MVEDLKKSYGNVAALDGVSFEIKQGEVVSILGPNGAGKTTTVEILEGYLKGWSGKVDVLGDDPLRGGLKHRERIGIVLQESGVEPYMTVTEILEQRSRWYREPLGIKGVIEEVGLTEKADALIKTLSGGQRRRLDVALAVVGNPELIFLDEPTTGFDPSARRHSWELVKALSKSGKTILLTTHYMDEAQALSDRVIVMARGQIVAEGSPSEIGGRQESDATVTFTLMDPTHLDKAPIKYEISGNKVSFKSSNSVRDLHALTGWALDYNIDLAGLEVKRPTLEDVYINLTEGGK
ncbi:MAG: ABC transporter ATP-binding protein [Acidimicrobiales bacterium]|nr:ABC transporter ATP-binding protein [Acidimicrobiales bacterium]